VGDLPACLLNSSGLQLVDVPNNFFRGNLTDLRTGTALLYLDISFNNVAGTVPASVRELGGLALLDVSQNFFTGTIPGEAIATMQLTLLDFSSNCAAIWFAHGANLKLCTAAVGICVDEPQRPLPRCAIMPPTQPTAMRVTVVASNSSVLVSWLAPAVQHAPYAAVEYYVVHIAAIETVNNTQRATIVAANATRCDLRDLELDVWYSVSVAAANSAGPGAASRSAALYLPRLLFVFTVTAAAALATVQVALHVFGDGEQALAWRGARPPS
jgi:hypothetical protein